MRNHRNYQDDILAAIRHGEWVISEDIEARLGIARGCLRQDLHQLAQEQKLVREQLPRTRGGVAYRYRLPDTVPWSEWPSWTRMTDLPVSYVR